MRWLKRLFCAYLYHFAVDREEIEDAAYYAAWWECQAADWERSGRTADAARCRLKAGFYRRRVKEWEAVNGPILGSTT